jgi:hypothetical protein
MFSGKTGSAFPIRPRGCCEEEGENTIFFGFGRYFQLDYNVSLINKNYTSSQAIIIRTVFTSIAHRSL